MFICLGDLAPIARGSTHDVRVCPVTAGEAPHGCVRNFSGNDRASTDNAVRTLDGLIPRCDGCGGCGGRSGCDRRSGCSGCPSRVVQRRRRRSLNNRNRNQYGGTSDGGHDDEASGRVHAETLPDPRPIAIVGVTRPARSSRRAEAVDRPRPSAVRRVGSRSRATLASTHQPPTRGPHPPCDGS